MNEMNFIIFLKLCLRFWKSFVLMIAPIVTGILLFYSTTKPARCAYVMIVVTVYWVTEVLPLPVTALIPVFAFPLLGVLSTTEVSLAYMNKTNMMYLGGLIIAVSLEHSNLHKRIALFVILRIGQSPRKLLAGFMLTTMLLSIWISNSAAAAMMVPIVTAVLEELHKLEKKSGNKTLVTSSTQSSIDGIEEEVTIEPEENVRFKTLEKQDTWLRKKEEWESLKNMYFLGTAYAGNIGGTGSPLGSGANLVAKNLMESSFEEDTELNFGSWMLFNTPGMLLCTFLGWMWLQCLFIGCSRKKAENEKCEEEEKCIKSVIKKQYDQLGSMSFHEYAIISLFILAVFLWLFRNPGFTDGWVTLLERWTGLELDMSGASAAMFIVVLLFVIPAKLNFWPFAKSLEIMKPSEGCLTWKMVHEKVAWDTVVLLGGGFALAKASDQSGLSEWLGGHLRSLKVLPPPVIVIIVTTTTALTTELASNTATASILMPLLKNMSLSLCVNPLYLIIPATACCCYAFMLPVATPPNAIVYSAANMKTSVMIKAGIVMNLLCVCVINIMINSLGIAMFDVYNFPSWGNSSVVEISPLC